MPVHEETGGQGRIYLPGGPADIAYDTEATVEEATRLHEMVDRPNLFVKIPATLPGLVAIEEMISRGKSINVTLIFSLERYREVARAYTRGLQRLVENGGDPSGVHSVASFFVSRIDSEADPQLEELGAEDLEGELAIANAKLAYQIYKQVFGGARWQQASRERRQHPAPPLGLDLDQEPRLPGHHLRRQPRRPRNRQHHAQEDHRSRHGPRRDKTHPRRRRRRSQKLLKRLREAGLDYEDVTDILEKEGIQKFADPFNEMLEEIQNKSRQLVS